MFGHLESSPQDSTCCQHYENSTAGRGQWSARESEKVLDGVGGNSPTEAKEWQMGRVSACTEARVVVRGDFD